MAAPNNAYRNKSLWMRGGTTNYEHKTAILQEDKATMLERFYIDDLVSVKVDGTNDGVIGVVIIGGDNEKMHNITTRGGVGRVSVNGQTARLLNDAGLNTKGMSDVPILIDSSLGNFTAKATHKSAYYFDGLAKMQYKTWDEEKNKWGLWLEMDVINNVPQNTESEEISSVSFNRITPGMRAHGIILRSCHENSEGVYFSQESTPQYATGTPINFTNTSVTYYMNTGTVQDVSETGGDYATELFTDSILNLKYSPSDTVELYITDTPTYKKWIEYGYSVPLDYICVLNVKEWTYEPSTPEKFDYNGYSSTSQALAENESMSLGPSRSIYFDSSIGKAYKSYSGYSPNWVFGDIADEGYYSFGNAYFVIKVYYIDSSGYYTELEPINK